jgi:hypothetical protein
MKIIKYIIKNKGCNLSITKGKSSIHLISNFTFIRIDWFAISIVGNHVIDRLNSILGFFG